MEQRYENPCMCAKEMMIFWRHVGSKVGLRGWLVCYEMEAEGLVLVEEYHAV